MNAIYNSELMSSKNVENIQTKNQRIEDDTLVPQCEVCNGCTFSGVLRN